MSSTFRLDHNLLQQRFCKAAAYGDTHPLTREIARRMDERLDYIRITPKRVLDLGCGSGQDMLALTRRYPDSQKIALDYALPLLSPFKPPKGLFGKLFQSAPLAQAVCADGKRLPLANASLSLVWSNLMLNWLDDPAGVIAEVHRVLELDGLFMFTTLGPDTLKQVREALNDLDGHRVHRFIDMHDLGDALVSAGFSDPVMDMDMVTVTYPNVDTLFTDLRKAGVTNASASRPQGLTGKHFWQRARQRLDALRRADGLPISFEVVQGHAWKGAQKKTSDGRDIIQFTARSSRRDT